MIINTVFARGAWRARHVPGLDCWCRPRREQAGGRVFEIHRQLDVGRSDGRRQRVFVAGKIEAPV